MTALRKTILLFRPSLISGVTCGIVTSVVIAVVAWSHIDNDRLFYDLLFGRYGITTTLLFVPNNAVAIQQAIVSSPITYYIIIGIAALTIAFLAYMLLQSAGRIKQEAVLLTEEMATHDPRLKSNLYSDLSRLGVRLAGLLAWLAFCLVFVHAIWPFIVMVMQMGLVDINMGQTSGWLYICGATVLLAISLHQHIVFIRLCMLRLRLFGDYAET